MKEVPVHEVPTHIETEDALAGIPLRRWCYLAIGGLVAYVGFMPLYLQGNNLPAFILAGSILLPFIILFFMRDENEKPEERLFYLLRARCLPRHYIWRFSAQRWETLHTELLGEENATESETGSGNIVTGWLDED